jgi:hypothetical protein
MKELFVPYDIALGLKEIDFDVPCIAYYRIDEINRTGDIRLNYSPRGKDIDAETLRYCDEYKRHLKARHVCGYIYFMRRHRFVAVAPTWDQVFEWFRNKFDWEFCINRRPKGVIEASKHSLKPYSWYISNDQSNPSIPSDCFGQTDTYKEAQIACLQRMIEQVKSIINH